MSKLSDVALVCALDMCRAATHVRPEGEVPLRIVAYDIAHEIKVLEIFLHGGTFLNGHRPRVHCG
jgi:hypothetical protein